MGPLIGPRDSIVRTLKGEDVPISDWVADRSEFVDARDVYFHEMPELWVNNIHDSVGF